MEQRRAARYRATVHYDGTGFQGWQIQPRGRTVQGILEDALGELDPDPDRIVAAGRTDRGVHATGQEIAVSTGRRWDAPELRRGLNALLAADVWIETLAPCSEEFHPRFDAEARRYEYLVSGPARARPLRRHRLWDPGTDPDRSVLAAAAEGLTGRRSFDAFAKSGQPERGTECHLREARWDVTALGDLRFTVVADRFLHHMVRYLVGTMVEEATGRRSPGETAGLLEGDGSLRPPGPAPPEGLYLTGVRYTEGWNRPAGIPGYTDPGPPGPEEEAPTETGDAGADG